jgi:hypothetical protein
VATIDCHQASTIGTIPLHFLFISIDKFYVVCFVDRFADKYRVNGIEYRTLTKMYGLRFILTVTGEGRKFDFYYLFLGVGMFLLKKCHVHLFFNLCELIKDPASAV